MFRPWTTLAKVGLVVAPFIILTFYHQPSLPITSCHLEPHYLSGFSIPRIHRTEKTLTNFRNNSMISLQCTMLPLLTKSCLKSNKLRPILNGQFCHAISKNIGLNLFGSKQPREILVFVILKL